MKLPKSFLAVNLSESHTFHKRDDPEDGSTTIAEIEAENKERESQEAPAATSDVQGQPASSNTSLGEEQEIGESSTDHEKPIEQMKIKDTHDRTGEGTAETST